MPLLNDFLIGADPEFALFRDGHARQFGQTRGERMEPYVPWGLDHSGWVIEPHPKPEKSVRQLVTNLKIAMNDFATVAPEATWRAGAYLRVPERALTFGGHVHIDRPRCSAPELAAMDLFTRHMEVLDILPAEECSTRRAGDYGRFGDIRAEHGHFEYRTMCSWLFSQRVTKVCLLGTKLNIVDPTAAGETLKDVAGASLVRLKNFFERFKHKDDDVDWVLESGILSKRLKVKPDRDVREVWRVEPRKEDPHWKMARALPPANVDVRPFEHEIRPFRILTAGHILQALGFRRPPTNESFVACFAHWGALRFGETYRSPITGEGYLFLGLAGDPWPTRLAARPYTNTVYGQRCEWLLSEDQPITPAVNDVLRVVGRRQGQPHGIQVKDGLLFSLERRFPTTRPDDGEGLAID